MKSPTHLDKCIVCPKCGTKTLRKAIPQRWGLEYFDDNCKFYFGVNELVNQYGYDASDLFPYYPVFPSYFKRNKLVEMDYAKQEEKIFSLLPESTIQRLNFISWESDTVSDLFEGKTLYTNFPWNSLKERTDAYKMVDRMFMGIPEWSMEDNSVDTGATHV